MISDEFGEDGRFANSQELLLLHPALAYRRQIVVDFPADMRVCLNGVV